MHFSHRGFGALEQAPPLPSAGVHVRVAEVARGGAVLWRGDPIQSIAVVVALEHPQLSVENLDPSRYHLECDLANLQRRSEVGFMHAFTK